MAFILHALRNGIQGLDGLVIFTQRGGKRHAIYDLHHLHVSPFSHRCYRALLLPVRAVEENIEICPCFELCELSLPLPNDVVKYRGWCKEGNAFR